MAAIRWQLLPVCSVHQTTYNAVHALITHTYIVLIYTGRLKLRTYTSSTICIYMHSLQIHTSGVKHYSSSNSFVAAIRQRGGFKTIAAKIGLSPQRLDKRGRKPKKPALQQSDASAEPAGEALVNLVQELEHQSACKQPPAVCLQIGELEQMTHELELV